MWLLHSVNNAIFLPTNTPVQDQQWSEWNFICYSKSRPFALPGDTHCSTISHPSSHPSVSLTSSFGSTMSCLCASVQRFTSSAEILVSSEISAWANSLWGEGEGCVVQYWFGMWVFITLQRVPELAKLVYAATTEKEISWWNGENVVVCQRISLLN